MSASVDAAVVDISMKQANTARMKIICKTFLKDSPILLATSMFDMNVTPKVAQNPSPTYELITSGAEFGILYEKEKKMLLNK